MEIKTVYLDETTKEGSCIMKTIIVVYRWTVAMLVTFITGLISLVLVLVSFGLLRNFCIRYIIKYSSRFILRLMGFKSVYPPLAAFPDKPVFYTFNHNSYLDVFLLTGIGLPNTRFILSEKTLGYIPVLISAKALGTSYIPQQHHKERRLRFFKRVTKLLKRRKISVAASAEGVHRHFHGIAEFNRGVFHMAYEAGLPVVMLFIHIPEECNPYKTKYAVNGELHLEIIGEVQTKDWSLDTLEYHIEEIRAKFIERFNQRNPQKQQIENVPAGLEI